MNIHPKHTGYHRAGFTYVELLTALSVLTVVLSAAAALIYAAGSAESAASKMGHHQARIRYATMRIRELARKSCLVFPRSNTGVVFWTGDENGDGQINGNEVAWLSTDVGSGYGTMVSITEFPDQTAVVKRRDLQFRNGLDVLAANSNETVTNLFEGYSSVSVSFKDNITTVTFALVEDSQSRNYQISAATRASADYLLSFSTSNLLLGDDDF